jgi:hypothetical protein
MNTWGISAAVEQEVRERDKSCVYCGVQMTGSDTPGSSRSTVATWEHIINDARIVTRENIALCCSSCNSSKGAKLLSFWLQSSYCKKRGITPESVAQIVRSALQAAASEPNNGVQATCEDARA